MSSSRYIGTHNYCFGFYSGYNLILEPYTVPCNLGDMETDVWIDLRSSLSKAPDAPTSTPKPSESRNYNTTSRPIPTPVGTKRTPPLRTLPSPSSPPPRQQPPRVRGQSEEEGVSGASTQTMQFRISGGDIVARTNTCVRRQSGKWISATWTSRPERASRTTGYFMNNYASAPPPV